MTGIIAQNTLDNSGLIKSPAGGGAWNFISKQTASADDTIDFTSGIDDTYKEYMFTFKDIHPATDGTQFQFNMSIDSGSNYNVAKTSTYFQSQQSEAGGGPAVGYSGGNDLAQGTGFQDLGRYIGNDNDQCCSGYLQLFNPSSEIFVKHFISRISQAQQIGATSYCGDTYIAGYGNTTSAVDAIQFKISSDEIDAGDICLYGLTT